MKKRKYLTVIQFLLISVFILSAIENVLAMETSTSSNTSGVTLFNDIYNTPINFGQGCGNTFTASTSGWLSRCTFYVAKAGTPNFNFSARLVTLVGGLSGDINATSYLSRSETKSSTESYSGITSFDFNNDYYIQSGQSYGIILYIEEKTSGDSSNKLQIGYSAAGNDGYMRVSDDSDYIWATGSNNDFVFNVYVSDQSGSSPTPTPTATPSPTPFTYQGDIWAALSPYANILLPLVLIIFIALLCGKYGGVWGFFAGLNVSAILVYAIMGTAYMPLWGLVMLALVDGLLLFGKISGRM